MENSIAVDMNQAGSSSVAGIHVSIPAFYLMARQQSLPALPDLQLCLPLLQ